MNNDIIKLFMLTEEGKERIKYADSIIRHDMFDNGNTYSIDVTINDPIIAQYILSRLLHIDTSYYGFNITAISYQSTEQFKSDLKEKIIDTINKVIDN